VGERILRKPEVRERIGIGKTMFEESIAPRLTKVQLGPRAVGFTESSVNRLIEEMIAATGTIPRAPVPSDKTGKRRAAK